MPFEDREADTAQPTVQESAAGENSDRPLGASDVPVAGASDDPALPDDLVQEVRIDFEEAFGTVLSVTFGGAVAEDPVTELPDKDRQAFRKQLRGVVRAQRRAESLGGVVHRS